MTGHLLGAAGALEAAVCALVVQTGTIPPTINQFTPDPACDLDSAPNKAVKRHVDVALSNSFGFGGHNVTLAIRRAAWWADGPRSLPSRARASAASGLSAPTRRVRSTRKSCAPSGGSPIR